MKMRLLKPELDIIKSELLSDVPALNKLLLQFSQTNQLKKLISQADMKIKVSTFILISLVLFAFGVVVSNRLLNILPANILIGVLIGIIPFLVVM